MTSFLTAQLPYPPACVGDAVFHSAHALDIIIEDVRISSKSLPENAGLMS